MFDYDIRDKIIIYSSCLVYKGEIIIEHDFFFLFLIYITICLKA
jgi:hypothetical protein